MGLKRAPECPGLLAQNPHGCFEIDSRDPETDLSVRQVRVERGDEAELFGDFLVRAPRRAVIAEIALPGLNLKLRRAAGEPRPLVLGGYRWRACARFIL